MTWSSDLASEKSERSVRPLRFGIVAKGTTVAAWEAACIHRLLASGIAEPALLVILLESLSAMSSRPRRRAILFMFYEKFLLRRLAKSLRPVSLDAKLSGVPHLPVAVVRSGEGPWTIGEEDVAVLRYHDLDFILDFGSSAPSGAILGAARHGVWSFRHGEEGRSRGLPPCLWEVANCSVLTSASLEVSRGGAHGRVVIYQGHFRTEPTYWKNLDRVLFGTVDWCVRICRELQPSPTDADLKAISCVKEAIDRQPTNLEMIGYLLRRSRAFPGELFRRLFVLEIWNVGVVQISEAELLGCRHFGATVWLPNLPRGQFWADPFTLMVDGKVHVLLEVYDWRTGHGWIGSVTLPKGNLPEKVIDMGTHLSYPYIFEDEGRIYCVPETSEAGALHLFEAIQVPTSWKHVGTLLDQFAAVDATIFRYDSKWWLFCTDKATDPDACLHAWYADDPRGPWVQHPKNPLKCDPRTARPAGRPFMIDGVLYRPAQDCSRTYGGAVMLNRVKKLTTSEFEEEVASYLSADPLGDYPLGLHTICSTGGITVIDGKRARCDLTAWLLKWQARRALRRRLAGSAFRR
jgi:hypothetical protein